MAQARYIDPFTDFGFKKLFGEEAHKDLLVSFLNALLPEKHRIRTLEYADNESGLLAHSLIAIPTVCIDENGATFIAVLQKPRQQYLNDRSVMDAVFFTSWQPRHGTVASRELLPVYSVTLLDFVLNDDHTNYLHTVQFRDENNCVADNKRTFIVVETPNFMKSEAELRTAADAWLYFLKHAPSLHAVPAALQVQGAIFARAYALAAFDGFAADEMDRYQLSLKHYRDMKNVINTAKQEGLQEGIEQGLQQGVAEGIVQGITHVARALKQSGLAPSEIARATGLTLEEIAALL